MTPFNAPKNTALKNWESVNLTAKNVTDYLRVLYSKYGGKPSQYLLGF